MTRRNKVLTWLTLLILLNIASSSIIYWQQSRKLEALSAYTLAMEVDKYLLECRRQEKNFFIRTSMEAIQQYTANHDTASSLILKLMQKRLPNNAKTACSALAAQMDNYQKAFRAISIYRRDNPVGNDMISMMHMCTEIARQCHSHVASIIAESEQLHQAANRTAGMITLILLIGTPMVSILIAVFIIKESTVP
ncbi:MAG: hypothetical protein JSU61_02130 [Fidelibacterota bacterium]|nr:MAG: hypothetical protein JSU61_02130 [Candidatus Neomarinimicrobiota bacterium]